MGMRSIDESLANFGLVSHSPKKFISAHFYVLNQSTLILLTSFSFTNHDPCSGFQRRLVPYKTLQDARNAGKKYA
jgi:hypothetical protein